MSDLFQRLEDPQETADTFEQDGFFDDAPEETGEEGVEETTEKVEEADPPKTTESTEKVEEGQSSSASTDTSGQGTESWKDKFKTPEEMFAELTKVQTSYNNLVPEFTKKSQELAKLKTSNKPQEQVADQTQIPSEIKSPEDLTKVVNAIVEARTQQALAPINERAEQLEMENALSKMPSDFGEYAESVYKILEEQPYLWGGSVEQALNSAYSIAKSADLPNVVSKLVGEALKANNQISQAKENPTVKNDKSNRQRQQSTESDDDFADGIVNISRGFNSIF